MHLSLPEDSHLPPGEALCPVRIPGSKSITNRALLLAALASGTSKLRGGLEAEDTRWMRQALQGLGFPLEEGDNTWSLRGGQNPHANAPLWLGASGTTLRFLLPWLALAAEGRLRLEGDPRLFERPLGPLLDPLQKLGAQWSPDATGAWLDPAPAPPQRLELRVDARLSSQFLSGLAMVAAALPEPSRLTWAAVASPSYLILTTQWLHRFGCAAVLEPGQWRIPGGTLRPQDLELPGDWSGAAAFLAAAAATGRTLRLGPLDPEDAQGDRAMVAILASAGCRVNWPETQVLEVSGPLAQGLDADLTDCPDLGPVLAALAALAPGPSELRGLHTLSLKECDRLDASAELVRWLGGQAEVVGDHTLRITPGTAAPRHRPPFDPRNDHRMAFAAALGGLRWGGNLLDPQCVAKTFPDFWNVWRGMLGC
jgi:3-phosphoshikimate 1-carboxyvinyltransferase